MWNPLFIWSLKAGLILSFLFAAYYLLFRNNTQFQLKRVLQMVILLAAISFPLIKISVSNDTIPTVYAFQQLDNSLTSENPVLNPSVELAPTSQVESPVSNFSKADIIWWIYLAGVGLSALIILIELAKLSYLLLKGNRESTLGENIISHPSIKYPFSFMKWIFVPTNSEYTDDDWRIIQAHENLHLNQRHTLDILFASFTQCVLWYHPAVYLIQRSMKSNHEALADSTVLASTPYNQYSKTLLALSLRTNTLTLSHSFSLISSLSKRLKLMKIQKTSIKKTFVAAIILSGMISLTAFETMVYGQDNAKSNEMVIDFFAVDFISYGESKTFSSKEIYNATGKRANGWLSVGFTFPYPIILNEKHKNIITQLQSSLDASEVNLKLELSESKEAFFRSKFGSYDFTPSELEFVVELSVEERLELYELSKEWANQNISRVYTDYRIASEMDIIPLRYLIITMTKKYNFNRNYSSEDIFDSKEVDINAVPVGGLDRFLKNVTSNIQKDNSLNKSDYPDQIEFEFIVTNTGYISMVNLITDIDDQNIKQKQLYNVLKQLNDNLINISYMYKWTPARKDSESVSSKFRLQIPKSLL